MFESCFSEETKTPSIAGETSAEKTAAFAAENKVDTKRKREARKIDSTKRRFHAVNTASRLGFNCRKNCVHSELTDAGKEIRDALKQKKNCVYIVLRDAG